VRGEPSARRLGLNARKQGEQDHGKDSVGILSALWLVCGLTPFGAAIEDDFNDRSL
jgi:hypothetical protein